MTVEVVKRKISQIDSYISQLSEISREKREDLPDRDRFAAERLMLLLMETASDLLGHILRNKFSVKTASYQDVFKKAAENSLIDKKLKDILLNLSSFRNKLVHQYVEVEPEDVLEKIDVFVVAFVEFVKQVKVWAGKLN